MIKAILSFLLLFLFTVTPVSAANPNVSLRTDPTHRYVFLTFANINSVSKVNYTLTYVSNNVTKGFVGGFKTYGRLRRSVRRQILGTCSSGRCVFTPTPTVSSSKVPSTSNRVAPQLSPKPSHDPPLRPPPDPPGT